MIGTLARLRLKILAGAALLALAAAMILAAPPAEAQSKIATGTLVSGQTAVCILEQGGGPFHTCRVTVPGTGQIAVTGPVPVSKSGIVNGTPQNTGRDIPFIRSTIASGNANNARVGTAVWTITDTNSGTVTTYKVSVTVYASGTRPQGTAIGLTVSGGTPPSGNQNTPAATGPVYKIEFLNDGDGVVQAGTNVGLKITRTNGDSSLQLMDSISISGGLSLRAVRRDYYADDEIGKGKSNIKADVDTKPDVLVTPIDIGSIVQQKLFDWPAVSTILGTGLNRGGQIAGINTIAGTLCKGYANNGAALNNSCAELTPPRQPRTVGTAFFNLEVVVPVGTPDGEYVVAVKGAKSATDLTRVTVTRTLTVGSPPSVSTVSFGPSAPRRAVTGDTDEKGGGTDGNSADGYADDASKAESTTIPTGGTTELTLSLQSALNKPPEAGTVSSIFVTTTNGTLSTESIGPANSKTAQTANCKTQSAASCEINLSALSGALPAKIRVQLKAPATPGTATVRATVIAGGKVHTPEPVTVTFTGPAKSLSIGEPPSTVLGYNVGKDQASDYDAAKAPDRGADARDRITFMVKATDGAAGAGNVITTPTLTVAVHDSAGALVSMDKYDKTQSTTGLKNMLTLDVKTPAATALKPGEYKLTLSSASPALKAERMFTVVGDGSTLELELAPMSADAFGQTVTATARVQDASGNPVAAGTAVTFKVSDFSGGNDAVAVLDTEGAVLTNKDGVASAALTVVGAGNAVVRATTDKAGGGSLLKTAVLVSRAGAPADAEGEVSLDCLSELSGFAVWTCGGSTASALFELLSARGATAIHLWNGSVWVRYSMVDGAMVPGSRDFAVGKSDIIYISN